MLDVMSDVGCEDVWFLSWIVSRQTWVKSQSAMPSVPGLRFQVLPLTS